MKRRRRLMVTRVVREILRGRTLGDDTDGCRDIPTRTLMVGDFFFTTAMAMLGTSYVCRPISVITESNPATLGARARSADNDVFMFNRVRLGDFHRIRARPNDAYGLIIFMPNEAPMSDSDLKPHIIRAITYLYQLLEIGGYAILLLQDVSEELLHAIRLLCEALPMSFELRGENIVILRR